MSSETSAGWKKPVISFGLLIFILSLCSAFAPFATDMYLPGFSKLLASFKTDPSHIETTISVFFLGLSVGQIIYGPIIDRFGRRIPLLVGIAIFILSSLGCLLVSDINVFIGLRLLQALGGCSGMIIGRAIVTDLFADYEIARVMSVLMTVMALAPICAPLIGGVVVTHLGWEGVFYVLLALGIASFAMVWHSIPETQNPQKHLPSQNVFKGYAYLCTHRDFLIPALSGSLAQGCMFGFITGSPFIFLQHFGLNEQHYSWMFGCISLGLIIASQCNGKAIRHAALTRIYDIALICNLVAAVALVLLSQVESMWLFVLPLWLVVATLGFTCADSTAIAMAHSGEYAGSGSGLLGLMQFGSGFVVSAAIAACQAETTYPTTIALLICSLLANACWFLARPAYAKRSATPQTR